ncbi:MAG: hypothetical protein COU66_01895 [Candidatus Pacebacteria bacterium CG10_big_fil_rev_8_21_14_0_10_44_11]|nr:MAG: hypothetical protein COU66_01895 [Candidatus Pacebacteria bacterium CG10_big_fil_rev_8_21_14_0_10_44_11]
MSFISKLELSLAHNFWFLQPDIHERQRYIASLIKPGQTILDVGGEQPILGKIAQATDYYTINLANQGNQTPKYLERTEKNMFYDGKHLPFKDKEFDGLVCVDVLEHVPQPDRKALLKEMLRVTKNILICSAPLGTENHTEAEKNLFHSIKDKKMTAFLAEHIERGLPTPDEVMGWANQFHGKLTYSGDFRWSNLLFTFQLTEIKLPILNHLWFFCKLGSNLFCNLFLFPFIAGATSYSQHTNRFYLKISN